MQDGTLENNLLAPLADFVPLRYILNHAITNLVGTMADETANDSGSSGDRSGVSGRGSRDCVRLPAELLVEARTHGVDVVPSSPRDLAQQLSASIDEHRAAKAKAALERSLGRVDALAREAIAKGLTQGTFPSDREINRVVCEFSAKVWGKA